MSGAPCGELALSHDGSLLAATVSSSGFPPVFDRSVLLWDVARGAQVGPLLQLPADSFTGFVLAFDPSGETFVAAGI